MNNVLIHNESIAGVYTGQALNGVVMATSTRRIGSAGYDRVEKLKEFAALLEINPHTFVFSRQVHGDRIHEITHPQTGETFVKLDGVDAMITPIPGVMLSVFTADCVPVFFADPVRRIVAIAHCGWKGTLRNLTRKVIQRFLKSGCRVNDLHVHIGPAICGSCYEVSPELIHQFKKAFGNESEERGFIRGRCLDLKLLNMWQAQQEGVQSERLAVSPFCTKCRNDLFYSYRTEGDRAGRMISTIYLHDTAVNQP